MSVDPISTCRLTLIPCSLHAARDAAALPSLIGLTAPAACAHADVRDVLPAYATRLAQDPSLLGWGPWLMAERAGGVLVGDAGFYDRPSLAGAVEIGYEVLPECRPRGFATEAVSALIDWAFAQGVRLVTASCSVENVASARVLAKVGMHCLGPRGDDLAWQMPAPPAEA